MVLKNPPYFWKRPAVSRFYYALKPWIPRGVQIRVRRFFLRQALASVSTAWPIDPASAKAPKGWTGWPEKKRFALVLTHDVESSKGLERCRSLAELEMSLGFRSSFNFLVRRYTTPAHLREFLAGNGFEVGIHGCYHDGKKFSSREVFLRRAAVINEYLKKWNAKGFRAPAMQCNLEWIGDLDIDYDLSTFDTDPFETQAGGAGTIYPFLVGRRNGGRPFVELPYTLPQDSTLFIMLGEEDNHIWKRKLDWIAQQGGMALLNAHPDYMVFDGSRPGIDEYACGLYEDFLMYVREVYAGQYYHCLPGELAAFYAGRHGAARKEITEGTMP